MSGLMKNTLVRLVNHTAGKLAGLAIAVSAASHGAQAQDFPYFTPPTTGIETTGYTAPQPGYQPAVPGVQPAVPGVQPGFTPPAAPPVQPGFTPPTGIPGVAPAVWFDTTRYPEERAAFLSPEIQQSFPLLREFEVLAPSSQDYNAYAYAVGVYSQWLAPSAGPTHMPLAGCDQFFGQYGFVRSPYMDLRVQPGVQKIVVYAKLSPVDGSIVEITSASVQGADGTWSCKVGSMALIRFANPRDLSGTDVYGEPVAVYMRAAR